MAVTENTVFIEQPTEIVFDYLVDLRNELKWNPQVESMVLITEGPIGVGSKFLAKWKQSGSIEVECTKFDRPNGWTYSNGGAISVILNVTLTPNSSGSDLKVHFDAKPNGLLKLAFPIIFQVLKRNEKKNMLNIKRALEALPNH